LCCRIATGAEEGSQESAALVGEDAGGDLDAVVECGVVHDGEDGAAGPGLGVGGGVDESGDAGVEDGSGAHGAGFEGDIEGAALSGGGEEAIVRERLSGCAEGNDLGVGGGVVVAEDAVVAGGEDLAGGRDDDCADWDLAGGLGRAGGGEGECHVVEVGLKWVGHCYQGRRFSRWVYRCLCVYTES
jgi:hypothetical protein